MKKKTILLSFVLLMSGMMARADIQPVNGWYDLGSVDDLQEFTMLLRNGQTSINGRLTADIDMSGVERLMPLGYYNVGNGIDCAFRGQFDGQCHVIRNFHASYVEDNPAHQGFFGHISGGSIMNLGFENATLTNEMEAPTAVLCAQMENATITNCYIVGDVTVSSASEFCAAFVGKVDANTVFTNCYTTAESFYVAEEEDPILTNSYDGSALGTMAASGELCYLLNADQSVIRFRQTIGTDDYPVFGESHKQVYAVGSLNCDGTAKGSVSYSNTYSEAQLPPHQYDEDGYCYNCGVTNGILKPTEDGWYNITTPEQLRYVSRSVVNNGNNHAKIRLMNDLDMTDIPNFPPMGTYNDNGIQIGFQGEFDGQRHIIRYLTVVVSDGQEAGLFGRINGGGYIHDFGVVDASVTNEADIRAGVIAGEIHACTVNNVFSAGSIEVNTSHGQHCGISGEAAASVLNNCYTTYESITNAASQLNNCYWGNDAAEMAETGALCYKLNHESFQNPTWYQTLGEDEYPVLDNTRGLVYYVGEDEYASASTDADYRLMVNRLIAVEMAKYDEVVATKSLVNNYMKKLEALKGSLLEDYQTAYNNMAGLRTAIQESANAYAKYVTKVAEVTDYLDKNQSLEGEGVDMVISYLEEQVEPSEAYPNGSSPYILEKMTLLADELNDEITYLQSLLETAIAQGYAAGSDITTLVKNPGFTDQTNGWTYNEGQLSGWWNNVTDTDVTCVALSSNGGNTDLSQTITGLKNGIYEVHISAYTEFSGGSSESTYNYSGFIYANDNKNYVTTQRSDLQGEDITERYPGKFDAKLDVNGDVQGYGPCSIEGVAYAFSEGYYDNCIIAKVTDGTLTLGINNLGTEGLTNDIYLSNAKLIYLGTMENAEEGLDKTLASMQEKAGHVLNDYIPSVDTYEGGYRQAPTYMTKLNSELSALVAKAEAATTSEEKYALIHSMGEMFQTIHASKQVYVQLPKVISDITDAYYDQNCTVEEENYMLDKVEEMVSIYEEGSADDASVEALIAEMKQDHYYLASYGVEPKQVNGVYQISEAGNLVWFSYYINNVNRSNAKAAMTCDIDMSSVANFKPIGTYVDGGINACFDSGEFDGQGHVIRNLNIVVYDGSEAGLFSRAYNTTIKNLGIVNAKVVNESNVRAGVLGGELHRCNIINCYTTGDIEVITDHDQHGGIAGECAEASVRNCWTTYQDFTWQGSVENCYYGADIEPLLATGELAFRLNGNQETISWYQTIGEDSYPVLDKTHGVVYVKGEVDCGGNSVGDVTYSNEKQDGTLPAHEFDENGICIVCGTDGGVCSPSEDGYFHISNAFQLRYFANYVNTKDENAKARLDNDIDMSVIDNFPMLGHYNWDNEGGARHFRGEFDGQGHVIRNLTVTVDDRTEAGFASRSTGGTFRNLGFENATITNTHPNGVRAGVMGGELHMTNVYNCWTCGDIQINTPHSQKGGFGGEAAAANFYNCWTTYKNLGAMGTAHNSYAGDEVVATIATGELCYKLNGGKIASPTWRQTLGEDAQPVLDPTHKVVFRDENGNYTNGNSKLPEQKGTETDPFIIEDVNDLMVLNDYLVDGQINYVKLAADIDMAKIEEWIPLCNSTLYTFDFDGQGHTISNLTCKAVSSNNSFFGVLQGNLRNIGFENMTVADGNSTGMIAAKVGFADNAYESVIEHVYVTGKLTAGGTYAGGMFGTVQGETTIKNCYANVAVNATSTYTGGIIGQVAARLSLENVYAAGSTTRGGGIVGGGQTKDTPASSYINVAVWNNDYEIFGRTARGDVKQGILFYDSTNFAEMQKAVVAWDNTIWSCDMLEDSYPVLVGSADQPDAIMSVERILKSDAIYDLSGRRVSGQPQKGLYIVGGKKVMFK